MKLKELAGKIEAPTYDLELEIDGGTEKISFPRLTIGDWKVIKIRTAEQIAKLKEAGKKPIDMWALLLSMSDQVDDAALKNKTEEQKETVRRKAGMQLFKDLDHSIQLLMFHRSLQHIEPEVTEEETDKIISYGIQDQAEYMRALMFLIYGVTPEAAEATSPLEGEDCGLGTPSGEGLLAGEGSRSSSPDGTGSRKRR